MHDGVERVILLSKEGRTLARPYPIELRRRAVSAYDEGEGSIREIAERFTIGTATLKRWLKRAEAGCLDASPMGGSRGTLVDAEGEKMIHTMLTDVPDLTLVELSEAYTGETGVVVSPQTMSATVARMGFTRKRGSSVRWQLNARRRSRREKPTSKASLR